MQLVPLTVTMLLGSTGYNAYLRLLRVRVPFSLSSSCDFYDTPDITQTIYTIYTLLCPHTTPLAFCKAAMQAYLFLIIQARCMWSLAYFFN